MVQEAWRPGLWYVGGKAGLLARPVHGLGGDTSSPFDYVLVCRCNAVLGPLGRFAENERGERTPWCPRCEHVTIVGKRGQITGYEKLPRTMLPTQAQTR